MTFTLEDFKNKYGYEGQLQLGPITKSHDFIEKYGDASDPTFETQMLDMDSAPMWKPQQINDGSNEQNKSALQSFIENYDGTFMPDENGGANFYESGLASPDAVARRELYDYSRKHFGDLTGAGIMHGLINLPGNIASAAYELSRPGGVLSQSMDDIPYETPNNDIDEATWLANKDNTAMGRISNWSKETSKPFERNPQDRFSRLVYGIADSLPESLAMQAIGFGAGNLVGRATQAMTKGAKLADLVSEGSKIANIASKASNLYNGSSKLAQAARFLTPRAETFGATLAQSSVEGALERYHAIDDYIEEAKRNGTYVKNKTEQEAIDVGNKVFGGNMMILPFTNALEYATTFGKKGYSIVKNNPALKAKIPVYNLIVSALMEGNEEAAQEIIQRMARNQQWSLDDEEIVDSFITGAIMGGGQHIGVKTISNFGKADPILQNDMQAVNQAILQGAEEADNSIMPIASTNTPSKPAEQEEQSAPMGADAVMSGVEPFLGVRMDNGANGCVEAVTKIGAQMGSPFLSEQLRNGVVYVPTLVQNAGDRVIPFDPSQLEAGDIIVYGDDDHVVMYDGQGGYVGNSSSQQQVVHGGDYNSMSGLQPTKIIKNDGNSGASAPSHNMSAADAMSRLANSTDIMNDFISEAVINGQMDREALAHLLDDKGNFKNTEANRKEILDNNEELFRDYLTDLVNSSNTEIAKRVASNLSKGGNLEALNNVQQAIQNNDGEAIEMVSYATRMRANQLLDSMRTKDNKVETESKVETPASVKNLLDNAGSKDNTTKNFYRDFVADRMASIDDVNEINNLSSMLNTKGKLHNTPENRQALAKAYPQEIEDYYNNVYAPRHGLTQQAQEVSLEQIKSIVNNMAKDQQDNLPAPQPEAKQDSAPILEEGGITNADQNSQGPAETATATEGIDTENQVQNSEPEQTKKTGEVKEDTAAIVKKWEDKARAAFEKKYAAFEKGVATAEECQKQIDKELNKILRAIPLEYKEKTLEKEIRDAVLAVADEYDDKIEAELKQRKQEAQEETENTSQEETPSDENKTALNEATESQEKAQDKSAQNEEAVAENATTPIANETETDTNVGGKTKPQESHFETGTFTHTKTGKELPEAKFTDRVDRSDFLKCKKLAKQYAGWYSNYSKSFLFETEAGRDAFIEAAEKEVFEQETQAPGAKQESEKAPATEAQKETPKQEKANTATTEDNSKAEPDNKTEFQKIDDDYYGFFSETPKYKSLGIAKRAKEHLEKYRGQVAVPAGGFADNYKAMAEAAAKSRHNAENDDSVLKATKPWTQNNKYYIGSSEVTKTTYDYYNYLLNNKDFNKAAEAEPTQDKSAQTKGDFIHDHVIVGTVPTEKASEEKTEKESVFGDKAENDAAMLEALGINPDELSDEKVLEAPEGIVNTAEERARLEKELMAELNKLSANPVFNPKIYSLGLQIGMTYVKDGINTAKKLVAKLKATFGDKIGPWAPAIAETISTWPKGVPFNENQVMAISKAVGSRFEEGLTSLDDIQASMKEVFKNRHKEFAPMIEASYNGIKKYFDMKEAENNEQRGESTSTDGGHASVESGGSRENKPEGTGAVSGRDGQEGTPVHGSTEGENTEGSATGPVREGIELEVSAGKGNNKRRNKSSVSLTEAQKNPSPTETPGHDYEIKDNTDVSKKKPEVRFKQNIDAIKMLKQLEADDRMPTPSEQDILAGYNGWGGLKSAFLDNNEMNKDLREVLTEEEYEAARNTINDAFYTSPKIIRAMWEGISRMGFDGGRILEPSMGIGNFFGAMPRDIMENSSLHGVEIDDLTSRFAKMLYPNAQIEHTGFQKAKVPDNFFDLVVSNIPFGQLTIDGYQIHNYFFANGMDKVRPGGLMVYITSQGSLAGSTDAAKMRSYLDGRADMIGAFKLPAGAFGEAGTSVSTDIVIFQKRENYGRKSPYAKNFMVIEALNDDYGRRLYEINEYFRSNPDNILGKTSRDWDQYGKSVLRVDMEGTIDDVAKSLSKAMKKLPKDIYSPVSRNDSKVYDQKKADIKAAANEGIRDYAYYVKDNEVYQNQGGEEVQITDKKKVAVLKDFIQLKNTLNALLTAERDPKATDEQIKKLRKLLNKDYDAFVKKHGYLNDSKAARYFKDDPFAGFVQVLEKPIEENYTIKTKNGEQTRKKMVGVEKSDIFTKRTMQPKTEVTHVEKPDDALIASLTNKGYVDVGYMSELMGTTPDKIVGELGGKIYKNPTNGNYETREEYLSGNVKEKLAQAEAALAEDENYKDNVEALQKVVPPDLVSSEIDVMMGAPWIPESDVQDFVDSIKSYGDISVKFNRMAGTWLVSGYGGSAKYKLDGIKFPDFIESVLNNSPIKIYDGSGDKRTLNQQKTDAANLAADEMRRDFGDWIWRDKDRENRLVKYYNDNFNTDVVREYDGSHLTFPGMNSKIEMKPHQKNVVWRMLQGLNTLIAHCVGAGKTFEMQAAGMEMRRLGIANKPMYCLPNNVLEQFAREFRQLYPQAKILTLQSTDLPAVQKTTKIETTEDGRKKKVDLLKDKTKAERDKILAKRAERTRMLSRIRSEDWDAILISHTLFERFPLSPETTAQFIRDEIDLLERTILEAKGTGNMDTRALSNMVKDKQKLKDQLEEALSASVDDIGISFEDLGIDQLFVDEADLFKNLGFKTKLGDIRGLNADSKSNRARDMFAKTQWLTKTMGGRGVVFATGTPISNTMAEMYIMLRYLDSADLKKYGFDVFDNWIRTFGDIGQDVERKSTGDGFTEVTKVKKFVNMTELKKMFRKIADIKTQDELDLDIPKLKNDKPTVVTLEPDPVIVNYIRNVVPKRVAAMGKGFKKQKGDDNMLALTNDLRKLSLNDDKIEACAERIAQKYFDTTDVKGAQLVFCDMGIPKAESGKDKTEKDEENETFEIENPEVYKKLIDKLIEKGIPEKEIAFIQNYNTKKKRDAIFQKVNDGTVRVLVGSTETMGAGTNCQQHLVALHDLDAPWRPRDLEQRHGRILRQGNENKEVEIFNYVVKDSFDANMWEKLKNKAAIIAQAVNNDMSVRTLEDVELSTISYAEIEEAATGNPLIKERLNVNNALIKEKNANTAFKKKIYEAENVLDGHEKKVAEKKATIKKIEEDIANRKDTKGDNFSITLDGKEYTERKKADEALKKVMADLQSRTSIPIGSFGGMALKGLNSGGKITLQLVGKRAYEVKTNSIQGVEYILQNGPEQSLKFRTQELKDLETNIKQAEEIVKLENPHEAKVKELNNRLNEIDRQIKESLKDNNNGNQQTEDNVITDPETGEIIESKPSFSVSVSEEDKQLASEGEATDQRSTEEIKDDVFSALPNPLKVEDHGDTMTIYMPNDVTVDVEVVDNVSVTDEELEQARKEHGIGKDVNITVNGKFKITGAKRALISLARNGKKGTAYHEIVHLAYELALTKEQKHGLNIAYGDKAKAAGKDIQEFVADKMRDDANSKKNIPKGLKMVYDAINDMIDKLKRAILGQDTSAYKTMRDIETGKVFENSVDNQEQVGDNEGEIGLDDGMKTRLYNTLEKHIDDYIARESKKYDVRDIMKELVSEHPALRTDLFSKVNAILIDLRNHINDSEVKRKRIESIKHEKNIRPEDVDEKYQKLIDDFQEVLDYGGVLYREITLDRQRYNGVRGRVVSWRTAEQQRDEREGNGIRASISTNENQSEKAGFSNGKTQFSISPEQEQAPQSFLEKVFSKFGKSDNIKAGKIIVEQNDKNSEQEEVNLKNYIFSSPSRIAEKVASFKYFYTIGKRAMDVLTQKRSNFERKLNKAMSLVDNKEDYKALSDVLLSGDMEGKEWTKAELIADGIKENVAEAYVQIRRLMDQAYKMVNDARRRPQTHTINKATEKQLQDLRDNNFVDILSINEDKDGHKKVTYKEYANWERNYTVDGKTLQKYQDDPAMQVVDIEQEGDDTFNVTVRESIPPVNKLTGYIPHFFHNYMVRVVDRDGNTVRDENDNPVIITSARTEKEAVEKAEEWLKNNKLAAGETIHIAPKIMDFTGLGMNEGQYAAVMGDKDYYMMMNSIAKKNDMTLAEAKEMMNGSVRQKNRHRFFGNLLQRKGVKGYEDDINYILRHYFNSASRYYAMETEFKPKAINMYERLFGDFSKDAPNKTADYTKDYINDLNGNPTTLEKAINEALMKSKFFRKFVASHFGDRAALQLASNITGATSYMCLGYLNVSSALLNLTQLINTSAYLNDFPALGKALAKGFHHKYNLGDLRILHETNVLNDIGLDSGSGYDMNRMSAKNLLGQFNKGGMILFKKTEAYCRCATVLAAYESGRKKGMSHNEAIEYAKEINRKSNFDYGVADAPNLFRRGSIISQLALQFKKYGIKELEVMADMLPGNSKTDGMQKVIFWGLYLMACGLMGWPALDWLDELFGGKLKPKVQEYIMEAAGDSEMGQALGQLAMYGLAAPTVGIDISSRAGLNDVVPSKARDIGGPSITRTISLASDMFQGKWADALRDISPGLYNQYAAWIAGQSMGKRDRVNNYYDSWYDKGLRAMGFKSTEERIASDIQRITSMRKKEATEEKQRAIDDYIENPSDENLKRLKELGVKPKTVKEERKKKKMDRLERTQSGMSKGAKKENKGLLQFAQ